MIEIRNDKIIETLKQDLMLRTAGKSNYYAVPEWAYLILEKDVKVFVHPNQYSMYFFFGGKEYRIYLEIILEKAQRNYYRIICNYSFCDNGLSTRSQCLINLYKELNITF